MPAYYNPYMNAYPVGYAGFNSYNNPMPSIPQPQQPQPQYMITVDGENAAKSWQPPTVPQPNTIIPVFDSDGQHVYFKTYDAYGRMNPIRKGRIVFDDEIQMSETPAIDTTGFVTKEDFEKKISELLEQLKNQNGGSFRGDSK